MEKNYLLYVFEFIASIFVVFIHCEFPGIIGNLIETIARFAVPFFFIITGFFGANLNNDKIRLKIKLYVQKFLKLIAIYLILRLTIIFFTDKTLSFEFSLKEFCNFILFNNTTFVASHLWYLMALIYCYLFILIIGINNIKRNHIFIILPFICIPISIFFLKNFGMEYSCFFRNWFLIGVPFFSIGLYLNSKKEKIALVNNKKIIFFIFFGIFLTCLERILIKYFFDVKLNLYYGSIITSISIFILCMNNRNKFKKFGLIVANFSESIYYYHYIFVILFDEIFYAFFRSTLARYFAPILVLGLSLILSIIISKLSKKREGKSEF